MATSGSNLPAGKVAIGTLNTAAAISAKRKRQILEKSVPATITVINELVQLDEKDFKPEDNTDRVGFTHKYGYFPDSMSHTDLLNAKITFAKIFAKDSKFSLTDSNPPCDIEEYGVLTQGLENRFKNLRHQILVTRKVEGDSIKTRALLDQAIKMKLIIDNIHANANEKDCRNYSGPEFSIKSLTSINEQQMQRLIKNFSLMVLQAIHPIEADSELFKNIEPAELVKALDNVAVDDEAVENYLNEYQKTSEIPRLIGLILSEAGPRDKVMGIMNAEAKKSFFTKIKQKILNMLPKQRGGGSEIALSDLTSQNKSEGSNFEVFLLTIQNDSPDDKVIKTIEWLVSNLDRTIATKNQLESEITEYKAHSERTSTRIAEMEVELEKYKQQRTEMEKLYGSLKGNLSAVASKFGTNKSEAAEEADQAVYNQELELQKIIVDLQSEIAKLKQELRIKTQQYINTQAGGRRKENEISSFKSVLTDITSDLGDTIKSYAKKWESYHQKGGQLSFTQPSQSDQIDKLDALAHELKERLENSASSTGSEICKKMQSELDKAIEEIRELKVEISDISQSKRVVEGERNDIYKRVETLATMIRDKATDEDVLKFLSTGPKVLNDLYARIIEQRPGTEELYNPCFLNYFIGFFIRELFFSKKSNSASVYSTLLNKLSATTEFYPLLDQMFIVLENNEKIDDKNYPELYEYFRTMDFTLDAGLNTLFKQTFPDFYDSVMNLKIGNGIISVPYILLFTHYIILARKYLVSIQNKLKGCKISDILLRNPNASQKSEAGSSYTQLITSGKE